MDVLCLRLFSGKRNNELTCWCKSAYFCDFCFFKVVQMQIFFSFNNRSSSSSLGRQQWRRDNSTTNTGLISGKYLSDFYLSGKVKTAFVFPKQVCLTFVKLFIFKILFLNVCHSIDLGRSKQDLFQH